MYLLLPSDAQARRGLHPGQQIVHRHPWRDDVGGDESYQVGAQRTPACLRAAAENVAAQLDSDMA